MRRASARRCLPVVLASGAFLLAGSSDILAQEPLSEVPRCSRPVATSPGPRFIPYDVPPRLTNPERLRAAVDSIYRDWYPDADVEGTVRLWIWVDCEGRAHPERWIERQGERSFELALLVDEALAFATYEPARNRGLRTAVYLQRTFRFPPPDPGP